MDTMLNKIPFQERARLEGGADGQAKVELVKRIVTEERSILGGLRKETVEEDRNRKYNIDLIEKKKAFVLKKQAWHVRKKAWHDAQSAQHQKESERWEKELARLDESEVRAEKDKS